MDEFQAAILLAKKLMSDPPGKEAQLLYAGGGYVPGANLPVPELVTPKKAPPPDEGMNPLALLGSLAGLAKNVSTVGQTVSSMTSDTPDTSTETARDEGEGFKPPSNFSTPAKAGDKAFSPPRTFQSADAQPADEPTRTDPVTGLPMPAKGYQPSGIYEPFQSALDKMIADAPGKLSINSGYRTVDRQKALWERALKKYGSPEIADNWVAPPGRSNHNYGLAADLGYSDPALKQWVHDNAGKYGLKFRMGHEDWHIEPLNAMDIRNAIGPLGYADGGSVADYGYRRDNPGGEWLSRKQESADDRPQDRGIRGAITGSIGMTRDMFLPTAVLKQLPGLNGERRAPGDPQYDHLAANVERDGFKHDQDGNRVVVAVNHRGEPYLMEGNTRVAVAHAKGVPHVRAEVRYWNGGEDVDGPFHPEKVSSMARGEFAAGGPVDADDLDLHRAAEARERAGGAAGPSSAYMPGVPRAVHALGGRAKENDDTWWHGTPSGDLRGGVSGLHLGTKEAALDALRARIGVPADGSMWDGSKEYGKTKLAGKSTLNKMGDHLITGHNVDAPDEDYYPYEHPRGMPYVGNGVKVDPSWKPSLKPYKIVGDMSNTTRTPHSDTRANAMMKASLTKGSAKRGYYYTNDGEDSGSISAVVPNGNHVQEVDSFAAGGKAEFLKDKHPSVPDVLYHGTRDDFGTFNRGEVGDGQLGFHMGELNHANHFANSEQGGNVMPLHPNFKNPIRLRDRGGWSPWDVTKQLLDKGRITREHAARVREAIDNEEDPEERDQIVIDLLHNLGHDSIVYMNRFEGLEKQPSMPYEMIRNMPDEDFHHYHPDARDSYIALKPNQIKSATGNNGDFDPDNDDITKAEGGAVSMHAARLARTGINSKGDFWQRWQDHLTAAGNPNPGLSMAGSDDRVSQQAAKLVAMHKADAEQGGIESVLASYGRTGDDEVVRSKMMHDILTKAGIRPTHTNAVAAYNSLPDDEERAERASGGRLMNPAGMYSKAAEVARALPQATGTVDQMMAMLKKAGVKQAELENAGRPPGDTISREDLAKHFEENLPPVTPVRLGAPVKIPKHVLDAESRMEQLRNVHDDRLVNSFTGDGVDLTGQPIHHPHFPLFTQDEAHEYHGLQSLLREFHRQSRQDQTKYGDYTVPGGRNYQEHLLTYPKGEERNYGHWDDDNVLAHVRVKDRPDLVSDEDAEAEALRFSDRIGEDWSRVPSNTQRHYIEGAREELAKNRDSKSLHVEEVQSDWGQKGRSQGFRPVLTPEQIDEYQKLRDRRMQASGNYGFAKDAFNSVKRDMADAMKPFFNLTESNPDFKNHPDYPAIQAKVDDVYHRHVAAHEALDKAREEFDRAQNDFRNHPAHPLNQENKVERAPYVGNTQQWVDLALKHVFNEAVKGGYDRVSFSPGEANADHYNMRKRVTAIAHDFDGTLNYRADGVGWNAVNQGRPVPPEELAKHIGEEHANALLAKAPNQDGSRSLALEKPTYIGGEGMINFYNNIVRKAVEKHAQMHDPDVKVEPYPLQLDTGKTYQGFSVPITDKIRDSVSGGLPAFAAGGVVDLGEKREEKKLGAFHKSLMGDVSERASAMRQAVNDLREAGKLPLDVGDRFHTQHTRTQGQPPYVVEGHYYRPKDGSYGYNVKQGDPDNDRDEDWSRTTIPVHDPKVEDRLGPERWAQHQRDVSTPLGGLRVVKASGGPVIPKTNKLGLYSKAAEIVRGLPQDKGTTDQMLAMAKKAGAKSTELQRAGRPGVDKIDRETLAQHFESKIPNLDAQNVPIPKYEQYTLPGGTNYRERLITLQPKQQNSVEMAQQMFGKDYLSLGGDQRTQVVRAMESDPAYKPAGYKSSHWDAPDVVAHVRMKDRVGPNGEKVLHVEEIQSDWGQDARKKGVKPQVSAEHQQELRDMEVKSKSLHEDLHQAELDRRVASKERDDTLAQMQEIGKRYGLVEPDDFEVHPETARLYKRAKWHRDRIEDLDSKIDEYGDAIGAIHDAKKDHPAYVARFHEGVPDAPYIGNTDQWTQLALKHALQQAVDGGYDRVAVTPGTEQAKRYSLSQNGINGLAYDPDERTLEYSRPGHWGQPSWNAHPDQIAPERLGDYVGPEVAQRLLATERHPLSGLHLLEGEENLSVGGQGMRNFYDKIVPKSLAALTGQKVEPVDIDGQTLHSVAIDPETRNTIARNMTAYQRGGIALERLRKGKTDRT